MNWVRQRVPPLQSNIFGSRKKDFQARLAEEEEWRGGWEWYAERDDLFGCSTEGNFCGGSYQAWRSKKGRAPAQATPWHPHAFLSRVTVSRRVDVLDSQQYCRATVTLTADKRQSYMGNAAPLTRAMAIKPAVWQTLQERHP